MAELYLGRAQAGHGIEKLVVLKRILPRLATDPEIVRLFLREARLAASLQHPNIVQLYDVGSEPDGYFLAMELVQGVDLRAMIARANELGRAIPIEVAVAIAIAICAGLHHAHERTALDGTPLGIVHCDVSPSNVLVAWDGHVKVADFGIAKAAGVSRDTRASVLRGKFGYMAPEQCLNEAVDRRSDVFAIAIVLAELTTGEHLFDAKSDFEVMKQIVEGDPPYPPRGAKIPAHIVRIVRRGLARKRDQRYPTAQAMQLELEAYARERKLAATPVAVASFLSDIFADRLRSLASVIDDADAFGRHLAGTLPAAAAPDVATRATRAEPLSRARRRRLTVPLASAAALVIAASLWVVYATAWPGRDARPADRAPARVPSAARPAAERASSAAPPIAERASSTTTGVVGPDAQAQPDVRAEHDTPRARARRPSRARVASRRRAADRRAAPAPASARETAWDPESGFPPPR